MSLEPIVNHVVSMSPHDREILLDILEVANKALILECFEEKILSEFMLALWQSVKLEEIE